jgi:MoaA/NifB/PqqE/SkfB family radical SAM enzyme
MKYDLEADFSLLRACNFRCGYCFVPAAELAGKVVRFASDEAWGDAFDAGARTWLIHVTGGEPFVYPRFAALCQRLARRHYLSINSNLSLRSVDELIGAVDPARVHFINAALHFEERRRRGQVEAFFARAARLRAGGFNLFATVVLTPKIIRLYPTLARMAEAAGVTLVPKLLRGPYRDRSYPQDYTPLERAAADIYYQRVAPAYRAQVDRWSEAPTIDPLVDRRFLDGLPSYRGRVCGSGRTFVVIDPDGTVRRCGSGQGLGNLLDGSFRPLEAPRACDAAYCHYFCEKYAAPALVTLRRPAASAS